jgi:hypothetical protein
MPKLERNFRTKFSYTLDTSDENGPVKGEIDLTTMSDDELSNLLFTIPEATSEIVFRELSKKVNNTNE